MVVMMATVVAFKTFWRVLVSLVMSLLMHLLVEKCCVQRAHKEGRCALAQRTKAAVTVERIAATAQLWACFMTHKAGLLTRSGKCIQSSCYK